MDHKLRPCVCALHKNQRGGWQVEPILSGHPPEQLRTAQDSQQLELLYSCPLLTFDWRFTWWTFVVFEWDGLVQ